MIASCYFFILAFYTLVLYKDKKYQFSNTVAIEAYSDFHVLQQPNAPSLFVIYQTHTVEIKAQRMKSEETIMSVVDGELQICEYLVV